MGLASCDRAGRISYDSGLVPFADGGIVREPRPDELIPAPDGTLEMMLPQRRPLTTIGPIDGRTALAVALPAGYTRLLLPAYARERDAPMLPLFGYTFACSIDDRLYVAAMRTDEGEDWQPRRFAAGELEESIARRLAGAPESGVLRQLALCSREYACFTAQNVFLERGEAALPVSPKCNARCIGCISELEPDAGVPSPQARIAQEMTAGDLTGVAIHHLERVDDGIVSFGQGCEGEPLLRSIAIARAIEQIRWRRSNGTINLNTNGSRPAELRRCIDAGLDAVRISLNSFRPAVYAAYYRPHGYDLADVLESIRLAVQRRLRVSLNLLTHPGVTDDDAEIAAMEEFLRSCPIAMVQTRTLNIDPERYFDAVGRPRAPIGMRAAIARLRALTQVGNFTHTH
ncbi:MAG: radical SAM protein [Candidatus Eremiobacteraeota bacterium]|nr:radical SAM protein [Candidatus Eremiobacteraeota bacterium]MBV9700284.1 radical SAM protein [Candidatus Eremiobacteraeota bacterium]